MKKKLQDLLESAGIVPSIDETLTQAQQNICITNLAFDTRAVKEGCLFFALKGVHVHGNNFIKDAINKGALAIVYQDNLPDDLNPANYPNIAFIHVQNSRFVMAPISDAFYDNPAKKLVIYGVTGTEGKSTTVFFIWQLLRALGKKAGFISTVEYSLGGEAEKNPEHQTTPEAIIINEKLHEMIKNGCTHAVIESSSHGLSTKTNRLGSVLFDAVAFMNVTHEHLEFHGTVEQYKHDKANLFRALDEHDHCKNGMLVDACACVNLDDEHAEYFVNATSHNVIGFSTKQSFCVPKHVGHILHATNIQQDSNGINFVLEEACRTRTNFDADACDCAHGRGAQGARTLCTSDERAFMPFASYNCRLNLQGTFNVYNAMAALILVSQTLNTPIKDVIEHLATLKPVPGRMTTICAGQNFEVIIDYAHTPSSFETILPPIKERACKTGAQIICVFGSAGERDTTKRAIQGAIASKFCNTIILTDEDPRGEKSEDILQEIASGCKNKVQNKDLFLIADRPSAISKAFALAKKGDIVLLLGKGHENSIIYSDYVMPYDEIAQAKKLLVEGGYAK